MRTGEREKSGARKAALATGARTYFTGIPCKRGHVAERYTLQGACIVCAASKVREQSRKSYFASRYEANRKKLLGEMAARYERNRAARISAVKDWQSRNAEKVRRYKLLNKHMRRAAEGRFDRREVDALLRIQRGECAGCAAPIATAFHVDHIIPIARGGTSWCGNLQLLCGPCNRSKSDALPVVWRRRMLARLAA